LFTNTGNVSKTKHHLSLKINRKLIQKMFCNVCILIIPNSTKYSIRTTAHNKTLISKTTQLNDRDFLIRRLHNVINVLIYIHDSVVLVNGMLLKSVLAYVVSV